jgi:hypothetical protein
MERTSYQTTVVKHNEACNPLTASTLSYGSARRSDKDQWSGGGEMQMTSLENEAHGKPNFTNTLVEGFCLGV